MKATKYTMSIETNTLSADSIPALLYELAENIRKESLSGALIKDDGDKISWAICTEKVEF